MRIPQWLLTLNLLLLICEVHAANEPVYFVNGEAITENVFKSTSPVEVSLSTAFQDGVIFYSTNGAAPSPNSIRYTGAFTVEHSQTVWAIAYSSTLEESALAEPLAITILAEYPLSVEGNGGTVTLSPQLQAYPEGTVVTVSVAPPANAEFLQWSGSFQTNQQTFSFAITAPTSLQAVYKRAVPVEILGKGTVNVSRRGVTAPLLAPEEQALLTATPDSGFYFVRWEVSPEDFTFATDPHQTPAWISMNNLGAPQPVTAIFAPLNAGEFTLQVDVSSDAGLVHINPPRNVFTNGEVASLQVAKADKHWVGFAGWTGATNSKAPTVSLLMDGNKTISAHFFGTEQTNTATLSPVDAEGNTYDNIAGALKVSGPTKNWTVATFPTDHAQFVRHPEVSIGNTIIYLPTYKKTEGSGPAAYTNVLQGVSREGTILWTRTNLYGRVVLDSAARAYIGGDSTFHALDPQTGATIWEGQGTDPVIGLNDSVISHYLNQLHIYNPTSHVKETFTLPAEITSNIVVDKNGGMFAALKSGLISLNVNGLVLWTNDLNLSDLKLAENNALIGLTTNFAMVAVDTLNGQLLWSSAPLINSDDRDFTYRLDRDGTLRVKYTEMVMLPMIMPASFKVDLGFPLAHAPWPGEGGNDRNTGKTWVEPLLTISLQPEKVLLQISSFATQPLSLYSSTNLSTWTRVGPATNGSATMPADKTAGFYKVAE